MVSSIGGGSGGFDMSAMKQMQEKMFKAMDTNGDGKVDKNEMSAFQKAQQADGKQGGPSVDEIFKNSDSNSDGGITLQEMQDSMAKITQQMWSQSSSQDPSSTGSTSSDSSTSSTSSIDSLLKTLGTALQSGNTTDANTALTALEKLASSNSADSSSTSTSSTSSTDNPFLKDLQSIGSDLASGNTTDAQSVLASIQQKIHGHHHGPPPSDDSSSTSSSSTDSTTSTSSIDSLLKTLSTALQSGNTTDANTALTSLEKLASSNGSAVRAAQAVQIIRSSRIFRASAVIWHQVIRLMRNQSWRAFSRKYMVITMDLLLLMIHRVPVVLQRIQQPAHPV